MAQADSGKSAIVLGDPVPWFSAPLLGDGAFNLQVAAGRWIVLSFLGSPANPKVKEELAQLLHDAQLFHEDRVVFYGVFTAPPADPSFYIGLSTFAISFIADYDGADYAERSARATCRAPSCSTRCCARSPTSRGTTPTATPNRCAR